MEPEEKTKLKMGILGGAFNPPHNAHLALAETAVKELGLDRLVFIPTRNPPHKVITGGWDAPTRSLLIKIAALFIHPEELMCAYFPPENRVEEWEHFLEYYIEQYEEYHHDVFMVSDFEINNESTSYTIETVRALLAENPGWDFHLIIGMDQAAVFDTWKEYLELSERVRICVADRGELDRNAVRKKFPFMKFFEFEKMDISSSRLRALWDEGQPINEWVPGTVSKFLKVIRP